MNISTEPATWIFQANPAHYDIAASLTRERTEFWNCIQHAGKIRAGDRVLIWISGRQAGIYALGEILTNPEDRVDSETGQRYWKSGGGHQVRPRVQVRYQRTLLDRPLLKQYLLWDPALGALNIINQPRGTNFAVTPAEWTALQVWLDD